MNPQYAPPQQYGIPPNPYGGYPNQGIPPPAQQKPPTPAQNQQPFPPQPGPNNFPGYNMTQNQGNAVPSTMTSPQSPPGNPPPQGGPVNSNYPPHQGMPNQSNPNFSPQLQTLGKPSGPPGIPRPLPSSTPQNVQNQLGPQQVRQVPQSSMPPPLGQPSFPSSQPANASAVHSPGPPLPSMQPGGGLPSQATPRGLPQGAPSLQQNHQQQPIQQTPQMGPTPNQSMPPQNMLPQSQGSGISPPSQGPPPSHLGFTSGPPSGMAGSPLGHGGPQQGIGGPPPGPGGPQGHGGPPSGPGAHQGHGGLPPGPGTTQGHGGLPPGTGATQGLVGPPPGPGLLPQGAGAPRGHVSAPSGPGLPPQGPGFYPPQQRMPMPPRPGTTFPNPANPDNLAGQVAGMNLNGPAPPMAGPNQQMNMNAPQKMGHPGMPPMPGQRFPSVNGGPAPQMNGIPDPNAPRPPMQHRYPQDGGQNVQGYPPMSSPPGEYPPQPGYMPQSGPYPAQQPSYPSGQQPRRLDPDHMPSPIQVVMEDQQSKSGLFYTNQKGQVPPLVTTDFITVDQGNASPRFMRSTMYDVPVTAEMMKQAAVPFALVISPMAELLEEEHPPPLVDFGETGPVRCIRCKAYMCPNMNFFEGGRRFMCLLCKASTEVPPEYFQHLDHTGLRVDRFERAELMLGAYDIVATKEYCRDGIPPKPPALIFLIDVSYNNVKSGLVSLLCSQMKSFLFNLPKERGQEKSSLRVGFITYNSSVHFYNINPNLGQPQMLVVGDVQEMFMPLLDGFLADVEQSGSLIDMLMQQIPTMFADTRETETVLAPAIQAGLEALKAAGCAGKLLVFHSSLPTMEAPGRLKNRDDRKLLGTEKEKTVLMPQNKVYNDLGQDCVQAGCSVDLFIFNNAFIDLPTIGQVARLTGGEVYKYTYFQADLDGERLINDVRANVKRLCAFDAIMRVRTSAGVRPTDFFGHFFMSNTTDIELAAIDPDKAIAVEIKHDDKLNEEDGVYVQAALLYTSLSGQRRIRILNLALKACCQMTELYRTCELDTIMNFFCKQAVFKLLDATPKAIRENYIQRSAQILACYRKNCASPTSAGQLILPECMKLLPLHMNCMLKSDAVSGGSDMTIDDRWFTMAAVSTMDIPSSVVYLYPRLIALDDVGDDMPVPVRCSAEKMSDEGVYLLENGIYMFLWIGLSVPSEWVSAVFGVPNPAHVDTDKNRLPVLDNPLSEKIRDIIALVGSSRHRSMRLTVVRQRDKMELVMKHFLVEDKGLDGSASYVDFLCHLHKEIRSIVS